MARKEKTLKVDIGWSENKGQGTYNGHITLRWPDKPADSYFNPGPEGKPFRSPQEAVEWARGEVQNLAQKIADGGRSHMKLA